MSVSQKSTSASVPAPILLLVTTQPANFAFKFLTMTWRLGFDDFIGIDTCFSGGLDGSTKIYC